MKKMFFILLGGLLLVFILFSYVVYKIRVNFGDHHDISIRIKETDDLYQLHAYYHRNQTHRVQSYMDAQLHTRSLFSNSIMDATVTLDDKTNFYIKSSPGNLLIRLNKNNNGTDAYLRIKELGEGLKHKLAGD